MNEGLSDDVGLVEARRRRQRLVGEQARVGGVGDRRRCRSAAGVLADRDVRRVVVELEEERLLASARSASIIFVERSRRARRPR